MRRHLATATLLAALAACSPPPAHSRAPLSVAATLSGQSTEGFEQALAPRAFTFPADHGPHPGFRTEWWYFTGNLDADDGRRFGYQLTFFKASLARERPRSPSAWATNEVWMAQLALTDVEAGHFHAFDRFERGALGLAGARGRPFAVWTGPWIAEGVGAEAFPLRLSAAQDGIALELVLEPAKELVLQGDRGLSQKGAEPGNASYYYSYTRLTTRGMLRTADAEHAVEGSSWLDREWSTSALDPGQVGWDWFALQLDDGRELMLYQLRGEDGTASPESAGTLVAAGGTTRALAREAFSIEPLASWTSPTSAVEYPVRWRVRVPDVGLDLEVRAALPQQELDLAFRYWEGAVDVSGTSTGRGYVELTGY